MPEWPLSVRLAGERDTLGLYLTGHPIAAYESVLAQYPQQPKLWLSYGHALKTTGRIAASVSAYRRALSVEARLGEAWWSLANLKTFRFSEQDVLDMNQALTRTDLTDDDRLHFEFALGKALACRVDAKCGSLARSFAIHSAIAPTLAHEIKLSNR